MIFNWIGNVFIYGHRQNVFSITVHGIELVFTIYSISDVNDENVFGIQNVTNSKDIMRAEKLIEEEVKNVYFIVTDDDFRKKFKRSYQMIKFETESSIISIGIYTDTKDKPTVDNSYLICTSDFINLLVDYKKVEKAEQLKNTPFENLQILFDKKILTKELLK